MSQAKTYRATAYIALIKPGIVMGNAMTALAGFALGAQNHWDLKALFSTIFGLCLVMSSACVFNNIIDRIADSKMQRTKNRPLATGAISTVRAQIYGSCLGVLGICQLAIGSYPLAAACAATGFAIYVALYSLIKYKSHYSTLIGSVAGAIPPLVGYLGATGVLDAGAYILFVIVALWQMPHFFAIAIYRLHEYAAASIPLLPLKRGLFATKLHMLFYTIVFVLAESLLYFFGYTTLTYLYIVSILGCVWLGICITGFLCKNETAWARKMFIFSLIVITSLCTIIPFTTK